MHCFLFNCLHFFIPYRNTKILNTKVLCTHSHGNSWGKIGSQMHCFPVNCLQEDISSFSQQFQVSHCNVAMQRLHAFCLPLWPSQFGCSSSHKNYKSLRIHQKLYDMTTTNHIYMFTCYNNHNNTWKRVNSPRQPPGLCDNETKQREILTFTPLAEWLATAMSWNVSSRNTRAINANIF